MLTDKHLEELRAERRADYIAEAVAEANAHLNNVGLPNYSELVDALRDAAEMLDAALGAEGDVFGVLHNDATDALAAARAALGKVAGSAA